MELSNLIIMLLTFNTESPEGYAWSEGIIFPYSYSFFISNLPVFHLDVTDMYSIYGSL